MDVRAYEVFFQFNRGLDQALRSLDILEKLAVEHVPGTCLYPPCPMPVEELRQLNRPRPSRKFPGPIFK